MFFPEKPFWPITMQHPSMLGPFVSYVENDMLRIWFIRPYSQCFIFFVIYKWVPKARVFVLAKPFWPIVIQCPSLLVSFVSYIEKDVLRIWLLGLYSQHLSFFETFKWAQKVRVFVPEKPFWPITMQHPSMLGPFVSYVENDALGIWLLGPYSQQFIFFVTYKWA